jgi:hypothetical protein
VQNGLRLLLPALAGALLFAFAPAALGDEAAYQVVVPSTSSTCWGFDVETIDGAVKSCTPFTYGVGMFQTEFSAAANGSVVFMAADNSDPSAGDQGSIWLVKPNGSPVHLDASPWDFGPTISYDGSKVVFARFDPATWSSDIYSVDADGSDLRLIVSGGGTNYLTSPSISPDGSSIAYWCGPAEHATSAGKGCGPLTDGSYRDSGVMRANIDGSNPRMIVIGAGGALEPAGPTGMSWSPDGQWIALDGLLTVNLGNSTYTAQPELFRYHTDGSDLFDNADPTRQVTNETDPYGPTNEEFSPDGSQLLYLDQGHWYLIGVDGTNRHEVFASGAPTDAAFLPTATPGAPPPLVDMTHITVPSVRALDVADAKSTLAAHNLTVGKVSRSYSRAIGRGRVLSQNPSAGAVAHRTTKIGPPVSLVISRGAEPACVVPNVKGKRLRAAGRAIAASHCGVGKVARVFSRTIRKGVVISQSRAPGRKLHPQARISLTVSKGKKP